MANAKKLPSGNYRVNACRTLFGKKEYKSFTDSDKRTAELKAATWQADKHYLESPSECTVADAIDRYIELRRNVVSPVTVLTYQKIRKNYFSELMDIKVSKLSSPMLQRSVSQISARLSPKSVRSAYALLSSALKEYNGSTYKVILPKLQKKKYNTPDTEMTNKILQLVSGTSIELPVVLAVTCGLRLSEVSGLKWEDVTEQSIYIHNVIVQYDKEKIEKVPKSVAGTRTIPITKEVYEVIKRCGAKGEYVSTKQCKQINDTFNRLLRQNKFPHYRFHDLRHCYASHLALAGVPEQYALKLGGWDTSAMYKEVYAQTFSQEEQKFAAAVSNSFSIPK